MRSTQLSVRKVLRLHDGVTQRGFYRAWDEMRPYEAQPFVIRPETGRNRGGAVVPLAEVVLNHVACAQRAGLFEVHSNPMKVLFRASIAGCTAAEAHVCSASTGVRRDQLVEVTSHAGGRVRRLLARPRCCAFAGALVVLVHCGRR